MNGTPFCSEHKNTLAAKVQRIMLIRRQLIAFFGDLYLCEDVMYTIYTIFVGYIFRFFLAPCFFKLMC